MRTRPLPSPGPLEPFDERDTVFARVRLVRDTDRFREYYGRRPGLLEVDERIRALPGMGAPGTRRYRPAEAALLDASFEASGLVAGALEGAPARLGPTSGRTGPRHSSPFPGQAELTRFVREAALFLGADDVGIAPLERACVYTHRGYDAWGKEVRLDHSHAVVVVKAMRLAYVRAAPEMAATCETGRVYQEVAALCFALASALEGIGIPARAHVESSYLVLCTPLAVLAGLGELGRSGVLVHRTLGPAVRLGVVTVGADLARDRPGCWGVADFCRACLKCADTCPAGAIPKGDPVLVRGALKWPMDPERCYRHWRTIGTDCGLCLRTCPFAKPDTALHRLVRRLVRDSTILHGAMLRADDLLYGRRPAPRAPPLLGIGPGD